MYPLIAARQKASISLALTTWALKLTELALQTLLIWGGLETALLSYVWMRYRQARSVAPPTYENDPLANTNCIQHGKSKAGFSHGQAEPTFQNIIHRATSAEKHTRTSLPGSHFTFPHHHNPSSSSSRIHDKDVDTTISNIVFDLSVN